MMISKQISACTESQCTVPGCIRREIYRRQMWFGKWNKGNPEHGRKCYGYLTKYKTVFKPVQIGNRIIQMEYFVQ